MFLQKSWSVIYSLKIVLLAEGDLVDVSAEDVLDDEHTEDGLGVVLDEEVLVDVLAEGDLVDVPAEDVLAPHSR